MKFVESTAFETEILRARMEQYLPALVHFPSAAIQRYEIKTLEKGALVECSTNDDDDDGYPDGAWTSWTENYATVEQALDAKGKCRVTELSGVIVTVTLDGKEIR